LDRIVMRLSIFGVKLLVLTLVGCAAHRTESIDMRLYLVGRWLLVDGGCQETHEFRADGTFTTASGEERLVGRYEVSAIANSGAPAVITRTVTATNGQKDCEGDVYRDNLNKPIRRYIFFARSGAATSICLDEQGHRCLPPLVRE